MRLFRDILQTYRAAVGGPRNRVTWQAPLGSSTNWRARHALLFLLISLGCLIAATWLLVVESEGDTSALLILGIGLVCFCCWRFLLPAAVWRAKVEQILYGKSRESKK
jgi:hypothetical protein